MTCRWSSNFPQWRTSSGRYIASLSGITLDIGSVVHLIAPNNGAEFQRLSKMATEDLAMFGTADVIPELE
jgi:hypothetical protein